MRSLLKTWKRGKNRPCTHLADFSQKALSQNNGLQSEDSPFYNSLRCQFYQRICILTPPKKKKKKKGGTAEAKLLDDTAKGNLLLLLSLYDDLRADLASGAGFRDRSLAALTTASMHTLV